MCDAEKFYRMDFSDFLLMRKGWFDEAIERDLALRRHASVTAVLFSYVMANKKAPKIETLWPLKGDKGRKEQSVEFVESSSGETVRFLNYRRRKEQQIRLKEKFEERKRERFKDTDNSGYKASG